MTTIREFRSGEHVVLITQSGIAGGPDYVLVHGLGMAHEYWHEVAEVLEATGTVYALDLPGFGEAPEPTRPLSMAESGELVAELLVAEGIERPVLVGHSTGAQVIAETAARHPELVDRIVLIGPTVNPRERTLAKQMLRFLQDISIINPKAFAQGLARYAEAGPRWYAANLRPMLEHRLELTMPQIPAEVLVIRGENDHVVPRYWAEEVAALAPSGRIAEVPGRGHDTMIVTGRQVGELVAGHARGEPVGRAVAQPSEPLKAERMNRLDALGWLVRDYAYATVRQLAVLGARRPPAHWRFGDPDKPEILLLPGVYEHWSFMRPLGDTLNGAGHRVVPVHGMRWNRRPIVETSESLERALRRVRVPAAGRVIVAHSKGGLIGKHLLLLGDGADDLNVRGVVAVCTPFSGARLAQLFRDPSIRALLPSDETIVMLGSAASVNSRIVSIFGTFDPHVPDGSVLDGATNVRVPVAGHFRVLGEPETALAVLDGVALLASPATTG